MTRTPQAHTVTAGDRVRVRPGVTGGVTGGDEGEVRSVGPLGTRRPVRVALDGDDGEPRRFDVDELELVRAAHR